MKVRQYRFIFPFFYGALTAGTYMLLKFSGIDGGIRVIGVSSLFCFLIHFIIKPQTILPSLLNKVVLLRGMLFALTQIFILRAQEHGPTSIVFIVSVFGSILGTILACFFLKEIPSRRILFAGGISIAGLLMDSKMFQITYPAAIAGAIQGLSIVTARSLIRKGTSIVETIGVGYLLLFITTFFFSIILIHVQVSDFFRVNYWHVLFVGLAILIIQYCFFILFKIFTVPQGSLISLSRIPWALFFEKIFLSMSPSLLSLISGFFIVLATFFTVVPQSSKKKLDPLNVTIIKIN